MSVFGDREESVFAGAPIELYRFSVGSAVWRLTSGDTTEAYDDGDGEEDFVPAVIAREGQEFSKEDVSGQIRVRMERTQALALPFIQYQQPFPVALTIYRKHHDINSILPDPSEVLVWFVGEVVSISFEDNDCMLSCAPITERLLRLVPALVVQPLCAWALYGIGCGVDREDFRTDAEIDAVVGTTISAPEFDALEDGWFTNGYVERANGQVRFIVDHVGDTLTLMSKFADLLAGETVAAFAGCMRDETTCRVKFDNLDRQLGYPRVPSRNPNGGEAIG